MSRILHPRLHSKQLLQACVQTVRKLQAHEKAASHMSVFLCLPQVGSDPPIQHCSAATHWQFSFCAKFTSPTFHGRLATNTGNPQRSYVSHGACSAHPQHPHVYTCATDVTAHASSPYRSQYSPCCDQCGFPGTDPAHPSFTCATGTFLQPHVYVSPACRACMHRITLCLHCACSLTVKNLPRSICLHSHRVKRVGSPGYS